MVKRGVFKSLLLASALFLASCVGSITNEPQTSLPFYMRGFTVISAFDEPAVGHILRYDGTSLGSGVLISQTHIITAGHVVDDETAYWFQTNGRKYCIDSVTLNPYYKVKDIIVIDMAICKLHDPCYEAPISLNTRPILRGESLIAIGFGGGWKKRSNLDTFWYYGTMSEDPFDLRMLCLSGTLWHGDSGGAVLDFNGNLVGIISGLSHHKGLIYDNSAVRIDLMLPWIQEQTSN